MPRVFIGVDFAIPRICMALAERILKSAAEGERNRERLREAALRDLAA